MSGAVQPAERSVDDAARLRMLELLIEGMTLLEVASLVGYHRTQVQAVAGAHGWPTEHYLLRSRDLLAARLADPAPAVATPKPAQPKAAEPRQRKARPAAPGPRRGTPEGRARQAAGNGIAPRKQNDRLDRLGVTVAQVKAWGTSNGHEVHGGGRLRTTLLDAYEEAHR